MTEKKNLKRTIVVIFAMICLVFAMATSSIYASIPDSAGNVFAAEVNENINCEKDYYWAGSILNAENVTIGYDAILAGKDISITLGKIGASLRAAGQNICINDAVIGHNATVAGETININSGTSMDGAYIAGKDIEFDGTANSLSVAGAKVIINGKIKGNVTVYAGEVVFGKNAVVTGIVTGTVGADPSVEAGANVPNMNISIDKSNDSTGTAVKGFSLIGNLFGLVSSLILGLFMCLIFKKPIASAGEMIKKKPVAMSVTGLISLIAVPIGCVILLVTIIGIPISFFVFALYLLILITAVAFAGASVGPLVFPKWNRWGASMLGVAVVAVVAAIPFIGAIVKLAAMAYALGYFILLAFYQMTSHELASKNLPLSE